MEKGSFMEEIKVEQSNVDTEKAWVERVESFARKYPISLEYGEEMSACVKENPALIKEDKCLELALLSVLTKQKEVQKAPRIISGGRVAITPQSAPKTIKEAGAQALEYLLRK